MSINRVNRFDIFCDVCRVPDYFPPYPHNLNKNGTYDYSTNIGRFWGIEDKSPSEVRSIARKRGWVYINNKDYCPRCEEAR